MESEVSKYKITVEFLTPMLGTAPSDPNIYKDFLIAKAIDKLLRKARTDEDKEAIEALRAARTDHELTLLPSAASLLEDAPAAVKDALVKGKKEDAGEEVKGKTIFRRNQGGLIVMGYMLKGFYKSAAKSMAEFAQPESRIDKWLYVAESEIPLMRNDKQIEQSDYDYTRPLRTEDKYGVTRVALAVSEVVDPTLHEPVQISFNVLVLPKGFVNKSDSGKFKAEDIKKWTEYGAFTGLGQWRNASYGSFRIVSFEAQPVDWQEALQLRIQSLAK